MKIKLDPQVAYELEAITAMTKGHEFSGFGYVEQREHEFFVYRFVLMDIGSWAFTQISSKRMLELGKAVDKNQMKCWIHRHPLGDGKPGPHNWSATDEATINNTPLGGIPQLIRWSLSIVRTPLGWVGRVDNHIQNKTAHLEVVPRLSPNMISQVVELWPKGQYQSPEFAQEEEEDYAVEIDWIYEDLEERVEILTNERKDRLDDSLNALYNFMKSLTQNEVEYLKTGDESYLIPEAA